MKRIYEKPRTEIVNIEIEGIIAVSGEGSTMEVGGTDNDGPFGSKRRSFWD